MVGLVDLKRLGCLRKADAAASRDGRIASAATDIS
jgi:hypothetical protein